MITKESFLELHSNFFVQEDNEDVLIMGAELPGSEFPFYKFGGLSFLYDKVINKLIILRHVAMPVTVFEGYAKTQQDLKEILRHTGILMKDEL